jgi:hypothetical protein
MAGADAVAAGFVWDVAKGAVTRAANTTKAVDRYVRNELLHRFIGNTTLDLRNFHAFASQTPIFPYTSWHRLQPHGEKAYQELRRMQKKSADRFGGRVGGRFDGALQKYARRSCA